VKSNIGYALGSSDDVISSEKTIESAELKGDISTAVLNSIYFIQKTINGLWRDKTKNELQFLF